MADSKPHMQAQHSYLESDLATLPIEAMADCAAWETGRALGPAKAG